MTAASFVRVLACAAVLGGTPEARAQETPRPPSPAPASPPAPRPEPPALRPPAPPAPDPARPAPLARLEGDALAQPEKPPLYKRWWFWTAVGGVVVVGVALAFATRDGQDPPASQLGNMEAFRR
jgi:hypothetical protein